MFAFRDALGRIAGGARHGVVVFEFNAGNHAQRRALANALGLQAIERDGGIPVVTSANCLQPDGQNNNGWDQGLLFLNPARVWLQPPGYVTQIYSRHHLPEAVACAVSGAAEELDAVARRSRDGRVATLLVVNPTQRGAAAAIAIAGFVPRRATAAVTELAGPLNARNTAVAPDAIKPREHRWRHGLRDGDAVRVTAWLTGSRVKRDLKSKSSSPGATRSLTMAGVSNMKPPSRFDGVRPAPALQPGRARDFSASSGGPGLISLPPSASADSTNLRSPL